MLEDLANIKNHLAPEIFSDQESEFQSAVEAKSAAKSLYLIGKIHYDKSDLLLAEKYFKRALDFYELPQDMFAIQKTLGFLIKISSEKLDDQSALVYIQKSEEVINLSAKLLGSLNAEYFYNLGTLNNYKGDFNASKDNFSFACQKAKEENEPELLAKCLLALATNSFYRKDYDASVEYLSQLKQILKIINKSYILGSMHMFSGKVNTEIGEYEKAIEDFKQANKILQSKKCHNLFGYLMYWRGILNKRKGDFFKALFFFDLALESTDPAAFKRLHKLLHEEVDDVHNNNVDIYLDRTNRKIVEKHLGTIDFKHRFVLLEILFLLAKRPGEFFDKERLARMIWKDEYNPLIHDKLIYTSVSRLRKLIEPASERSSRRKYIIRGKDGYTFNPNVKIRFYHEQKTEVNTAIANVDLSSLV